MRFIIGFVFFGVLFYSIWFYYPDAFQVLVSWAAKAFNSIQELILKFTGKPDTTTAPVVPSPKALFSFLNF